MAMGIVVDVCAFAVVGPVRTVLRAAEKGVKTMTPF